jgi:hypothetical protein
MDIAWAESWVETDKGCQCGNRHRLNARRAVTVLSVAADAPAVDTMVSVSIGMTILAGSVPGTYSGDFSVDVVAGTAASAP